MVPTLFLHKAITYFILYFKLFLTGQPCLIAEKNGPSDAEIDPAKVSMKLQGRKLAAELHTTNATPNIISFEKNKSFENFVNYYLAIPNELNKAALKSHNDNMIENLLKLNLDDIEKLRNNLSEQDKTTFDNAIKYISTSPYKPTKPHELSQFNALISRSKRLAIIRPQPTPQTGLNQTPRLSAANLSKLSSASLSSTLRSSLSRSTGSAQTAGRPSRPGATKGPATPWNILTSFQNVEIL